MKKAFMFLFVLLVLGIGIYPTFYIFFDMGNAFLGSKPRDIVLHPLWRFGFFLHIFCGGLALLSGWSQFSWRLRRAYPRFHRWCGRLYVLFVLLSGLSGLGIALVAEGGIVARLGFFSLAVLWLLTTSKALFAIRSGQVLIHQRWMLKSFALTCAAVTLRLWLPFFQLVLLVPFIEAYRIIAWLCWVPNILFAMVIGRRLRV